MAAGTNSRVFVTVGTALASLRGTVPAHAQLTDSAPAASASSDEVIVTARRRAERLQDVPVVVSAFNKQQLDLPEVAKLATAAHVRSVIVTHMGPESDTNQDLGTYAVRLQKGCSGTIVQGRSRPVLSLPRRRVACGERMPDTRGRPLRAYSPRWAR